MLNIAFFVKGLKDFVAISIRGIEAKVIDNQSNEGIIFASLSYFLRFEPVSTLFEFNKPILKNRASISNDFEKNSTDFEGFRMDFETQRQFENRNLSFSTPKFVQYVFPLLGRGKMSEGQMGEDSLPIIN